MKEELTSEPSCHVGLYLSLFRFSNCASWTRWRFGINMQDVIKWCGKILGTSAAYQNKKKNIHINMCPKTFNLWVIAERILYMHGGAPAHFSRAVWDVLNDTYHDR
jgi:hypothetical protein